MGWQTDTNSPGWFNGQIDEVRISSFARAAFDIQFLTYDDNGNLTSGGDLNLAYDFLNRLVKVTRAADNSVVAEYAYGLTTVQASNASGAPLAPRHS